MTPAEYDVFRDNVALLAPRSFELSTGLGYDKNAGLIQSDRVLSGFVAGRVGVYDGVELGVTAPFYFSDRVTNLGFGQVNEGIVRSLGDVNAQITALVFKETPELPAVNISLGATFPTGSSPYRFSVNYKASGNPIDPFFGHESLGEWGTNVGVEFSKIVDPLVLFAGFGANYTWNQRIQGHYLVWPVSWIYNAGMAFAVSDKTTLGFNVSGSFQGNLLVDGAAAQGTGLEPILARFSLVQRIAQDTYLEPSVAIGISKDAPNLSLRAALRRRF